MKGRARRIIEHQIMSVITVKRPLRKRMPDTTVNGEEEAAEVTRFRHQVITEVARIYRGDPQTLVFFESLARGTRSRLA